MDFGLMYGGLKEEECALVSYVDFDFIGDLDKRRSQIGYLFTLEGGVVN